MKPRSPNKRRSKRDQFEKNERPAFVPRHIAAQFIKLDGVTEVKPLRSTRGIIQIILVMTEQYNYVTHEKIIMAENEIKKALKSRRQEFEASISWQ